MFVVKPTMGYLRSNGTTSLFHRHRMAPVKMEAAFIKVAIEDEKFVFA